MKTLLIVLLLCLGLNAEFLSAKNAHGKELFNRCVPCHGAYGEQRALGKSAIIGTMSQEKIMSALLGYKSGTYGGNLKTLMEGQVRSYSSADLEAIAEYVPSARTLSTQKQYPTTTRNEIKRVSTPIASSPKSEPNQTILPPFEKIQMKAKHDSTGFTYVKAMIKHPMLTQDRAVKEGIKQEYITRIVAKEDKKIVFDLISSEYLSKNPIFRFKYKSLGTSDLSIEFIDNNGNKDNLTQTIGEASRPILLNVSKSTGKEGKPYRVNIPAITKTFGDIELIDTDRIQMVAPDVASNPSAVPVDVYSDIKAKSVTLFANEEDAQMKFICQWRINEHSIIDYAVKIKMPSSGNIKLIFEGENGKFYTKEKDIAIALGGGN